MNIGLLITAYNRPQYLKKCLESVKQADLSLLGTLMIIDDKSTDPETIKLINDFESDDAFVLKAYLKHNRSIKGVLLGGIDLLSKQCDVIINLDGDAIVRKDFIIKLHELYCKYPDRIITGFNCLTKNKNGSERHKVLGTGDGFTARKSVGGINMMYSVYTYKKYVEPALIKSLKENLNWDDYACRNSMADGKEILAVSPSVVQHIGIESSMGHSAGGEPPDVANDFIDDNPFDGKSVDRFALDEIGQTCTPGNFKKLPSFFRKLELPNVTLVGADCVDVDRLLRAADISCNGIDFGAVKILSSIPSKDHRVIPIRHLASKGDYSTFMMKELADYIDTDYMLVIQYDGWVVNHKAWRDEWFNYDYIGAAWKWYKDRKVGNGGFSFRSKRLHRILKDDVEIIPINEPGVTKNMEEDHCIARLYGDLLKYKYKIKFAPESEADLFSIEAWGQKPPLNKYNNQFGFHGFGVDFSESNLGVIPYLPGGKINL